MGEIRGSDEKGVRKGKEGRQYLGIARVCVEDVGEEFAGAGHAGHDQAMDVVAVNDKVVGDVHGIPLRNIGPHGGRGRARQLMVVVGWRRRCHGRVLIPGMGWVWCTGWWFLIGEAGQGTIIDHFGHAVEVDEEAEEDFICGGAVLVDARQIAGDGYGGDVLAMKGQHARGLLRQWGTIRGWDLSVQAIVGGGDLGQEAGDHVDDVGDGHGTDLVLLPTLEPAFERMAGRMTGSCQDLLAGKALNVTEISDFYSAWGVGEGAVQGDGGWVGGQ